MARHVRILILVSGVLLLGACAQDFGRDDAIVSLQAAGASTVEATCMADTLAVLGALDAARPEATLTEQARTDLVRARDRCATTPAVGSTSPEVPAADVAGLTLERSAAGSITLPEPPSAAIDSYGGGMVQDATVDEAVQRLVALGRSEEWATCVVDQLALLNAAWLLDSPTLGLGATPEEASAFVLCS